MKYNRLLICLASFALLATSCSKNRFDFSDFKGVQTEGTWALPIAHGNYTIPHLMQRFEIDSMIDYDPSGNMSFNFYHEQLGVISGEKLLIFDDLLVSEHYEYPNPVPGSVLPVPVDTVFNLSKMFSFESENIEVLSAKMKTGHFDFNISSNVGQIRQVEITSQEIKDVDGNDFQFIYDPELGITGFDVAGLRYETDEFNALSFDFKVHVTVQDLSPLDFMFDLNIDGSDFSLSEMSGYVDAYTTRTQIDTAFSVFPDNMSGTLAVEHVMVTLSERNTFGLDAVVVIDTAMVSGDNLAPISLVSPLPLVIDAIPSTAYTEVYNQSLDGVLNAHAGNFYITSNFVVNPLGLEDLVTVTDASAIDMRVNVNVPFVFKMDDVHYIDTVNMRLSEISMPEWIKKLTLELTFNSTIPFDLIGNFQMYDSEHNVITDTLLEDATLITASYDGQPSIENVTIEIDGERLQRVMRSNRIILDFDLGNDGRDVVLNANQSLRFNLKAKVEYDGVIEFNQLN